MQINSGHTPIKDNRFRFKQFSVSHSRSSLKVGVDGVLVGIWTRPGDATAILDVGTGCGVIALILAQLTSGHILPARIDAIDIDKASIEEATENFINSPWRDRLCATTALLQNHEGEYDLIVSNPPFFRSGVTNTETPRLAARHQESLPLHQLFQHSARLLRDNGRLSIILPADFSNEAEMLAKREDLFTTRICMVRGHSEAPWKRVLFEFIKGKPPITMEADHLTLEESRGTPTEKYRRLGKDFYLRF